MTVVRSGTSPYNADPGLTATHRFREPMRIYDGTIRKLLLTPGVDLAVDDALRVGELLVDLGITDVLLNLLWSGDAAPNPRDLEVCTALARSGLPLTLSVTTDAAPLHYVYRAFAEVPPPEAVFETIWALGVADVGMLIVDPGDPAERSGQLDELDHLLTLCDGMGAPTSLILSDPGRSGLDHFSAVIDLATAHRTHRLDVHDGYSSLTPAAAGLLFRQVVDAAGPGLAVTAHMHNDFGLSAANALAAAEAGAYPECSINGVSYRSGLAPTQEVVTGLEYLYGVPTGVDLELLTRASDIVADVTGIPLDPLKPVTGAHQFVRNLPAWVVTMARTGSSMVASCYDPALVGGQLRPTWGRNTSRSMVKSKLASLGLDGDPGVVSAVIDRIGAALSGLDRYPRWLRDSDVDAICHDVAAPAPGDRP